MRPTIAGWDELATPEAISPAEVGTTRSSDDYQRSDRGAAMPRSTPMDHDAADRISAAADKDPDSPTAVSGFDDRAQDAADQNDPQDNDC